ncbi:hypothetical protein Tco_0359611 [Tanacetum coccineum]
MKKENMSIEEMMREQLMVDDEIKDISNYLSYKRFRGEKIDDEYERDCEIKIEQLLQDYNGLGIEIRKKGGILIRKKKSLDVSRVSIYFVMTTMDFIQFNDDDTTSDDDDFGKSRLTPTPDCVLNSPSSFPIPVVDSDLFFEESDDFLLELPEFESFHFDPSFPRPPSEPSDVEICLHFEPNAPVIDNFNELNDGPRRKSEDTIFVPGHLHLKAAASLWDGTFMCLIVYTIINESPIEIFFSICFPMDNLIRGRDVPDFEDSRAHGFVHSYIRASYPQLHLGNPIS